MMNWTICYPSINDSCEVYVFNDTRTQKPFEYRMYLEIYTTVVFSLVSLLGTTGNGLVIWFCLFRMEKTVNVVWFLNLAIVDFAFALVLALIIINIAHDAHLSVGKYMHEIFLLAYFLNMSVSVLQLAVISVDRCICVVFPVWCHNHRARRPALIIVLIIWVVTIASNVFVIPSIYKITFPPNDIGLPIGRFVFFFLIPFIVIVSSYTVLILHIKDKSIIKSSKPFKLIVAMVIAFFICWLPYYVFVLLEIFAHRNIYLMYVYTTGMDIAQCLMVFNCCINPILYVFIGQDFKQKFCGSFQAMFEKAFREDVGQMNFKKNEHCSSSGLMLTSTNTSVI